jgi:hypothetical protein
MVETFLKTYERPPKLNSKYSWVVSVIGLLTPSFGKYTTPRAVFTLPILERFQSLSCSSNLLFQRLSSSNGKSEFRHRPIPPLPLPDFRHFPTQEYLLFSFGGLS